MISQTALIARSYYNIYFYYGEKNDNKEYGRSVERVHSKDYMNMSSYPLTRTSSKTNIETDKRNS